MVTNRVFKTEQYACEVCLHPYGGSLWKIEETGFKKGGVAELVQRFFSDEFYLEDYTLSIFDIDTECTAEIYCDIEDMPDIVEELYTKNSWKPITFIGINPLTKSYVVGMSVKDKKMIGKVYDYKDGRLVEKTNLRNLLFG